MFKHATQAVQAAPTRIDDEEIDRYGNSFTRAHDEAELAEEQGDPECPAAEKDCDAVDYYGRARRQSRYGRFYVALVRIIPPWWKFWQWEDQIFYISCCGDLTRNRREAYVFPTADEALDAIETQLLIEEPLGDDYKVLAEIA